jgi:hypothetical protein
MEEPGQRPKAAVSRPPRQDVAVQAGKAPLRGGGALAAIHKAGRDACKAVSDGGGGVALELGVVEQLRHAIAGAEKKNAT